VIIGIDASRAVTHQRTGTEAYAYFLLRALIPLAAAQNHALRLYFNQPPPPHLLPKADHVEIVIMPFPRLWTHVRLAYELHRRPPDVFFTPAHVIPFTYRGPSAATIHDLGYHHFPQTHPRRQLAYLRWATRHNGRIARLIFADSQATKDDLVRLEGLSPDKIHVVYPGLDPSLAPVTDEGKITAVLRQYAITPPYLLFISTLQPRKNLVRLIRAYTAANLPYPLVLAGKTGWLSDPIREEIVNSQWSIANGQPFEIRNPKSEILLPGFVADADKAALLSGATAFLYPSLYEGFGFPLLEAQACGAPVLAANTSSLPEIAGDSALLVDPLDETALAAALQRLVSDETLRQSLVARGLENVKRFSWEKTAVQILSLLHTHFTLHKSQVTSHNS
jgi:glycosyltransferase involved in cell wall biosynthesis